MYTEYFRIWLSWLACKLGQKNKGHGASTGLDQKTPTRNYPTCYYNFCAILILKEAWYWWTSNSVKLLNTWLSMRGWWTEQLTSYCSRASFLSSSSCSSCCIATCRARSFIILWFSSSCFSASVIWMVCCCCKCHFSSSALFADSSSSNLQWRLWCYLHFK